MYHHLSVIAVFVLVVLLLLHPVYSLLRMFTFIDSCSINQTNYFIVRLKVDKRAGQGLSHLGITNTEKIELKHKTDEQISPVNGLEP